MHDHLPLDRPLSRRTMLKTAALAGFGVALPNLHLAQTASGNEWKSRLVAYLKTLARPDGGFAWEGQQRSHLTPSFATIGCYRLLGLTPPDKHFLAEFIRAHHPSRLKKLEQEHRLFEYQQIQSLIWLDEDASSFQEVVSGWKAPSTYLKQYERHGYPIFAHELTAFTCRVLLGLPLEPLAPQYVAYLESRRRANGSFNNTPAADGGDGHIVNTWRGLEALSVLGREQEKKPETIAWLQACQLGDGGFTWQPEPEFAGNDDAACTRAALRSLALLGGAPKRRQACMDYLWSLANADGGFSDRPGWLSNPMAAFYAVDSLAALGALDSGRFPRKPRRRNDLLPADLQVFSIQIEAHGKGSPAEAVDLARGLKLHLWGAKNATPAWLQAAQTIADRQKVRVLFFHANEEYGTWVDVPGFGTYSHTSDIIAPAGSDFGASLANAGVVSWGQFRERRLNPLRNAGGGLVWQFGENEELARLYLDDSLQNGGYAAISTFHFGNPDFTNSEPFLQRFRGQIPFIALQDAHGDEPWWFADTTEGFRTVFLGAEPTWEAWLTALENNWVVALRHDAASGFATWMHGGSQEVLNFVSHNETAWRWWDNPDIQRPLVSIVAVWPEDIFEAGRPTQGTNVRVRCAWENTAQGRPKKPLVELVKLVVDGAAVETKQVIRRVPQGAPIDVYSEYMLTSAKAGGHSATAFVRILSTGETVSRSIEF